jgi:hypothetical protein
MIADYREFLSAYVMHNFIRRYISFTSRHDIVYARNKKEVRELNLERYHSPLVFFFKVMIDYNTCNNFSKGFSAKNKINCDR